MVPVIALFGVWDCRALWGSADALEALKYQDLWLIIHI